MIAPAPTTGAEVLDRLAWAMYWAGVHQILEDAPHTDTTEELLYVCQTLADRTATLEQRVAWLERQMRPTLVIGPSGWFC